MSGIGAEGRKKREDEESERPIQPTGTVEPARMADAKAKVTAKDGALYDNKGANGVLPHHEFDLDYMDARGRRWTGHFKCHALKYREKMQVGLIQANMSGGVAPDLLDAATYNLIHMLAHLSIAIDDAPEWARGGKLEELYDARVVYAIFAEVDKHEARFHGTESEGAGEGDDSQPPDNDGESDPPQDWTPS